MEGILSYLTSFIVVVGTVALIFLVKFFFRNTLESTKKWPYQRQLLNAAIVLLGLFLAIGFLPLDHQVKTQILSVLGILFSAIIAFSSPKLMHHPEHDTCLGWKYHGRYHAQDDA